MVSKYGDCRTWKVRMGMVIKRNEKMKVKNNGTIWNGNERMKE